ncbi:MAG TPA: FAD:protein FMN transferase [Pirellulales bacterium]|jgi:thiamine biosynthesis lipoprotein|nr:FAD:protein FMN transferase [Pirellulales bacterium]
MPPQRKSSRRAFLQGRAAAEALDGAAQSLPTGPAAEVSRSSVAAQQTFLLRVGRRAMACEFEVLLNAGQYADGTELAVAALDLVDRLEDQLTVFREHSEVSRLNRAAFEREAEVEPRLFELLRFAHKLHRRTEGAYDITSGPLSKVWGFYRRAGQMPSDEELAPALTRVGSQHLAFDDERRTFRFLKCGIEINLGSIGKGYALDRCGELLEARGVSDFMLHGGQSSLLARGSHGMMAGEGWWVGLRDPLRPAERLGEIRLRNRALGTSGSGKQFFYHEGRRYGHILDPRTGHPAEGMLSTTVLAPTAAEADALSTAFFVMGIEPALEYCRTHQGLGAVLVVPGAKVGSVDIRVFGLPETDWKLLRE